MAYRKIGNGYSLEDILEVNVDKKYYLNLKQSQKLLLEGGGTNTTKHL